MKDLDNNVEWEMNKNVEEGILDNDDIADKGVSIFEKNGTNMTNYLIR